MVTLVFSNFTNLILPLFIGKAVDNMNKNEFEKNGPLCLYLVASVVVTGFFVGARSYLFNSMSYRIARDLRRDFFEKVINQDIGFFDEQRSGELLSRMNNDIQIIQDSLSTNVSMFVRSILAIILVLVVTMYMSPTLTGVTCGAIVPVTIFAVIFSRKIRVLTKSMQDEKANMSSVAEESFSNVRTVKAFANELEECAKFSKGNEHTLNVGVEQCIWISSF